MSYTNVLKCGNDHQVWLKDLDFYKDEFDTLDKRLMEIAGKYTSREVLEKVEHFQNQFLIQRKNIQDLSHIIHKHEGNIAADIKVHAGKMNISNVDDHETIREKVEAFEMMIKDLRREFNSFLSMYM